MQHIKSTPRRKYLAAGAILLMAGSVATGGALVTMNSTIFDNVFGVQTDATGVNPGVGKDLLVTGAPMEHEFSGLLDGESDTASFLVENRSDYKATVDIGSLVHAGSTDGLDEVLSTKVNSKGSGSLGAMALGANDKLVLAPNSSQSVSVEVFVPSASEFNAKGFTADSAVTVDFQFDAIYTAP